jgi:hypothetical protein
VARAIRRSVKRAVSPREGVANEAEALANDRFGVKIAGSDFVTEIDGQYAVNVARMYQVLLAE